MMRYAALFSLSLMAAPPPGFRRVFHVDSYASTWQDHLLLRWEWLQDWFAGLLR